MPKSAVETVTGVESYFVSFEKNSPGRTSANDVAPSDSQNKKPNKTEKEKKNRSVGMGNKRWSRQTVVLTAIDTVVMDYMKVNNTQEPLTKLLVETHALSNGGTSCKEPVS